MNTQATHFIIFFHHVRFCGGRVACKHQVDWRCSTLANTTAQQCSIGDPLRVALDQRRSVGTCWNLGAMSKIPGGLRVIYIWYIYIYILYMVLVGFIKFHRAFVTVGTRWSHLSAKQSLMTSLSPLDSDSLRLGFCRAWRSWRSFKELTPANTSITVILLGKLAT